MRNRQGRNPLFCFKPHFSLLFILKTFVLIVPVAGNLMTILPFEQLENKRDDCHPPIQHIILDHYLELYDTTISQESGFKIFNNKLLVSQKVILMIFVS